MEKSEALAVFHKWMVQQGHAYRTRKNYMWHVQNYGKFRGFPHGCSTEERVTEYLSWIAHNRSEAFQKQALNAIVNLYIAIGRPLGQLPPWTRPKERRRIPCWVTTDEALAVITHLPEPWNEVASMLFGSGLRISECLNLRVKDLDFERGTVSVYEGKGKKDRITILARSIIPTLKERIARNRAIFEEDRSRRRNGVEVPPNIGRANPRAGTEWQWFWLWPAPGLGVNPDTGVVCRWHRHDDGFSKALKIAVKRSKINKRVTAHAFRHGFATAYLYNGGSLHELQELMGHKYIETTQIYLHCLPQLASRVASPLDVKPSNIIETGFSLQRVAA